MNIEQLLKAMTGAYKGFDAEAVVAVAGAFRQKLEKFEGKDLADAWTEVVSGFSPTARQPFPLPKDFEAALPGMRHPKISGGPALNLKAHAARKANLMADWDSRQKPQVVEKYGPLVTSWVRFAARDKAQAMAWQPESAEGVWLKDDELEKILDSAVSRDRVSAYGAPQAATWENQMTSCQANILAGIYSVNIDIQSPFVSRAKPPPYHAPPRRSEAEITRAMAAAQDVPYDEVPEGPDYGAET